MTRDEIKRAKAREGVGLLMLAFTEARRAAAAGKLGANHAGDWLETHADLMTDLIARTVDETAEAARVAATVKTVAPDPKQLPDAKPAAGGTIPMNGTTKARTGT